MSRPNPRYSEKEEGAKCERDPFETHYQPEEDREPEGQAKGKKPLIEFLSPSEIKNYTPPPGTQLIGDNHINRGGVFIIGGPPGVGKSRASIALAQAGAMKSTWLGLPAHCRFKTMIIQNENGRYRLKMEFSELDTEHLDEYLRISPPPPYGIRFDRFQFRDELKAQIEIYQPSIIELDPWNAAARDDKAKDYRETFDLVRDVIPAGDDAPAIGIVAHTRKPLQNERANGRALLNLLAGSHLLASVPRSVWILQHATDDVSETRVVVTCCKNNDGDLGPRSVWTRAKGLWAPLRGFDWTEWDGSTPGKKGRQTKYTVTQLVEVLGSKDLTTKEFQKLMGDEKGMSKATFHRLLEESENQKRLHKSKTDDKWEVVKCK